MKNKKVISCILGAILFTTPFLLGSEKMYVKKIHFKDTEQVLHTLDTNPLKVLDTHNNYVNTNTLNECLSKRKRLTYDEIYFMDLDIVKIVNLTEEEQKEIIEEYDSFKQSYLNTNQKIVKKEAVKFEAKIKNEYDENTKHKALITMVLIDEGEGLVCDYINLDTSDDVQREER